MQVMMQRASLTLADTGNADTTSNVRHSMHVSPYRYHGKEKTNYRVYVTLEASLQTVGSH